METYIDRDHRGYRPVAILTEAEYDALTNASKIKVGPISFTFSHWTRLTEFEPLDRVYVTAYHKGRKVTGTYAHRFYSLNAGRVLCSLHAGPMAEVWAQSLIDALQIATTEVA